MQKQTWTLYFGFTSAAALIFFAWLAALVLRGQSLTFDLAVREGVHAWANPLLTRAMRGLSWVGSPWFVVPMAAVLVWRFTVQGRRRAGILLIVAVFGGEALDQILKLFFRRPRPEAFFGLAEPATYSFPSGHAITAACFYGVLAALLAVPGVSRLRKALLWTGAALMAALIGLSRIYLGVHYVTDVLAGYAAAIVWVFAVRSGYLFWRRVGQASRPVDSKSGTQ